MGFRILTTPPQLFPVLQPVNDDDYEVHCCVGKKLSRKFPVKIASFWQL
jgi:hypothetical protein